MADDIYSREEFLTNWAKILKCDPNPYAVAVHLINVKRNYQTAMALIFGLSYVHHTDYLKRVVKYFEANWTSDDVATIDWLGAFVEHYVSEVEKYPEDAA